MDMSDSPIILKKRKPRKCQCCGGRVLPILYGYPSHESFEAGARGEIILGGCCIPDDFNKLEDWVCKECGQRYKKSADSVIRKKNITMDSVLWTIFSWIVKTIVILMIVTIIVFICKFIWLMATNGGRKWYYYDSSKPWKGGYWTPQLPSTPPYNEYEWNPETCRFEHKDTGEPLYSWQKPITRHEVSQPHAKKKRPEWLRFLFEETPATFLEKRRRKKWINERE